MTPDEIRELKRLAWEEGARSARLEDAALAKANPYAEPEKPTLEEWIVEQYPWHESVNAGALKDLVALVRAGAGMRHRLEGGVGGPSADAWDTALDAAGIRKP